jgi:hypothetical protein
MFINQSAHLDGRIRIYDEEGNFIGIYAADGQEYKPVKMFI